MYNSFKFFFISLLIVITITACSPLKTANKRFKNGEYELAIDLYKKALTNKSQAAKANYQIAESYRLSNRISESEEYYKKAIDLGHDDEGAPFYYAFALKSNSKYSEAKEQLDRYLEKAKDEDYIKRAKDEQNNLAYLDQLMQKESFYRVKNLESINTPEAEYSPVYKSGELYFTASRGNGKIYKATGEVFTDIYKVKTRGAIVDLATLEALPESINSPIINEGSVTFSSDGNTMIFAKGNSGKRKGTMDVDLYSTTFRNGAWSAPRILPINDPKAWDSSPSLSRDGKTLYFASNRDGGYGGIDLYTAKLDGRGRWGNVKNMGKVINTSGDEMFPFVSDDGKLYLSSNGHPGLGGLDLFVASRKEGKLVVENLGVPMNSVADDFAMFLFSPTQGFFTSNRTDGKGDDDIFTFVNNDPDLKIVNYYLAGITMTPTEAGTDEILPGVNVKLLDASGEVLDQTITGTEGRFNFRVYAEENYIIIGDKPDYFTTRHQFSTVGKSVPKEELIDFVTNKTFNDTLTLNKIVIDKSIVLENIYYDLDKWDIRPDAAKELDKLVDILKDNPTINIELSSHTDSRAPDDHNMLLSQRRAESAVNYLASKGVEKRRLVAKGYGETQLLVSDAEIALLSTEEAKEMAHQRNRRTEFKVTDFQNNIPDAVTKDGQEGDDGFEFEF